MSQPQSAQSTPGEPPTGEQLYKLLLIGLMYMREANADVLARPASSIYNAMRHAKLYTEGQRMLLIKNYGLMGNIQTHSTILHKLRMPPRREVLEMIQNLDTHLLFFILPEKGRRQRVMLQHSRLVGPDGYPLIITEAGIAYAHTVLPEFSELLDAEKFAAAWATFRSQARGIAMAKKKAAGKGSMPIGAAPDGEARVHIDRDAKYTEEDFEW